MSDSTTGAGAKVRVAGLAKHYQGGDVRIPAVAGVSLEFAPGTMTAITGPSGSGKSTLLHLIGAIEAPDAGTITVDDVEITSVKRRHLTAYRRRVGFVFQRYHLLPALTALDNVIAPVVPYRVKFDKAARGRELLAAVGLAGRENSLPSQLSGGQQQRVAIARALIGAPTLLLADEPTGNLDSRTGTEILDLLAALRAEHAMTVLVATHEQHVAAACDRLIRLRDGEVVQDVSLAGGEHPEQTLSRLGGPRL
ncbi:ABC transporter ATP-binding protein [Catellatospora sichuanensis]|uniref:ABC transporter ATP-binding protein n=1 Tax=Catellatospora sichuanensis TaxID=1969805 RepID=UPI001183725A